MRLKKYLALAVLLASLPAAFGQAGTTLGISALLSALTNFPGLTGGDLVFVGQQTNPATPVEITSTHQAGTVNFSNLVTSVAAGLGTVTNIETITVTNEFALTNTYNVTNEFSLTNEFALTNTYNITNEFSLTNEFSVTNTYTYTNEGMFETNLAIGDDAQFVVPHGLAGTPAFVSLTLLCTNADAGSTLVPGDELAVSGAMPYQGNPYFAFFANSSNVVVNPYCPAITGAYPLDMNSGGNWRFYDANLGIGLQAYIDNVTNFNLKIRAR